MDLDVRLGFWISPIERWLLREAADRLLVEMCDVARLLVAGRLRLDDRLSLDLPSDLTVRRNDRYNVLMPDIMVAELREEAASHGRPLADHARRRIFIPLAEWLLREVPAILKNTHA